MISKSSEWETPPHIFKKYNDIYDFNIDVCATKENALCGSYFSEKNSCLKPDWGGLRCWMNPPYGRSIGKFVEKAYNESVKGAIVVCLVPASTDTGWWHNFAMKGRITFIRGRLTFINRSYLDPEGNIIKCNATFSSAIVIFGDV